MHVNQFACWAPPHLLLVAACFAMMFLLTRHELNVAQQNMDPTKNDTQLPTYNFFLIFFKVCDNFELSGV